MKHQGLECEFERRFLTDITVGNATLLAEVSWILELIADQDAHLGSAIYPGLPPMPLSNVGRKFGGLFREVLRV